METLEGESRVVCAFGYGANVNIVVPFDVFLFLFVKNFVNWIQLEIIAKPKSPPPPAMAGAPPRKLLVGSAMMVDGPNGPGGAAGAPKQ